jgi:hypothetical protein
MANRNIARKLNRLGLAIIPAERICQALAGGWWFPHLVRLKRYDSTTAPAS